MQNLAPGTEQIHVLIQSGYQLVRKQLCRSQLEGPAGQASMSQQHPRPVTKANCILGCISKSIASGSGQVVSTLYPALVKLHLKRCLLLGSPAQKRLTNCGKSSGKRLRWLECSWRPERWVCLTWRDKGRMQMLSPTTWNGSGGGPASGKKS